MSNDYRFVSRWRLEGTCRDVADALGDPVALSRWWPAVYLVVDEIRPAGADRLGQRVRVQTKGWLPYTLRWEFETVESRYPCGFTIVANGDFDGRGVWTFEQDGRFVNAVFDWRLRVEKPLIRNLSFLLRPLFETNHRWAMARGEESLRLELRRRAATSDSDRSSVPPPPGPVSYTGAALVAGAAALCAATAVIAYRAFRGRGVDR